MELIFPSQLCPLDYLQLMELERGDRQGGYQLGLSDKFRTCLPGESQYHVHSYAYASLGRSDDTFSGLSEGMSTVYAYQRLLIGTLHTILHQQESAPVEFLQILQQSIGHAVGTSTNNQAHHIGHPQGFLVELLQM